MFCPRCGQQQVSNQIRFCSRCGFLMAGLAEAIATGGLPDALNSGVEKRKSARRRGLRQGGLLIFMGIFFVPLLGILSEIFKFDSEIVGLAAIVFFVGGFLRMLYAAIFESANPAEKTLEENVIQTAQKLMNKKPQDPAALPPQQSIPVDAYAPPRPANWRDTNELEPTSVTDETTKLLSNSQNVK